MLIYNCSDCPLLFLAPHGNGDGADLQLPSPLPATCYISLHYFRHVARMRLVVPKIETTVQKWCLNIFFPISLKNRIFSVTRCSRSDDVSQSAFFDLADVTLVSEESY